MDKEYTPTAESIMESLAKLLAHQYGCTVEDLVIKKKESDKKQEPA